MSDYRAPVKDMRFVMDELAGFKALSQMPAYEEATPDVADAILDEAARFTSEVLAPLNRVGDKQGCRMTDNGVTTPPGWKEAYKAFCEAGWNGIVLPAEFGGQGLPDTLGVAVKEMVCSANLSFSLGPLLTTGAVEALLTCASDTLKSIYLEKMITGEWTGTMNLTEPSAGSDLAAVRSRAEPVGDGTYRIFGQKIFITYGEHDMTDNIVHLVLARTPNAPEGVKGISLFVTPKFKVDREGNVGVPLMAGYRPSLELLRFGLAEDGLPHTGVLAAVCGTLPGESPTSRAEVQAMARAAQPSEEVGLEPYGAEPAVAFLGLPQLPTRELQRS